MIGGGLEGRAGPLALRAAAEAGGVAVFQAGTPIGSTSALLPRLDALVGADWRVLGSLAVDLSVSGGGLLVRTAAGRQVQPFVLGLAGVEWGW